MPLAAASQPQDLSPAGGLERFDDAIKADHDGIRGLFDRFFDDSADLKERQRTAWQVMCHQRAGWCMNSA
jgi:hypothetical protein